LLLVAQVFSLRVLLTRLAFRRARFFSNRADRRARRRLENSRRKDFFPRILDLKVF
jgi:hypothetical protein